LTVSNAWISGLSGVEGLDGRAHARAAGPDDQNVVLSDHSV
jgi:hypothetical protein